jgi:hypothetical protein
MVVSPAKNKGFDRCTKQLFSIQKGSDIPIDSASTRVFSTWILSIPIWFPSDFILTTYIKIIIIIIAINNNSTNRYDKYMILIIIIMIRNDNNI